MKKKYSTMKVLSTFLLFLFYLYSYYLEIDWNKQT